MTQIPISYSSPNPYPQPINRPTMLTVLAIIGIVFGALGVLCLGLSELAQLAAMANPAVVRAMQNQTAGERTVNLVLGLIGFVLSGILLVGSIGSLTLKPAARRLMISWSLINIGFVLARLLIGLLIFLPRVSQNAAIQNNPNGPQIAAIARVSGIVGGILIWAISTTFSALVFIYFQKPEIVSAFEPNPRNPGIAMPPPPM